MQNIATDKIILKILLLLSNIFIAEVILPTELFLGNQYAGYCFKTLWLQTWVFMRLTPDSFCLHNMNKQKMPVESFHLL